MPVNRISILCLLMSASMSLQAEETEEAPSEELLEFLGQWEKVDNEWVDPTELETISMLQQKQQKGESDDK